MSVRLPAKDADAVTLLKSVRSIAVVGASVNPARPSNGVIRFLVNRGYEVHPVNPGHEGKEIAGRRIVARLADVPAPIDMVEVFRQSRHVAGVLDEALALDPRPKVFWTQLGVIDEASAERAAAEGFAVAMNRCPAIDLARD